jgi:hypothetical protein
MAELLEIDMNDDGPTTTVKPQVVVIHDKRIQVDVVDLSSVYGEGQRGMTAKRNFAAGEPIQSEVATVYVTHALPAEEDAAVRNFFLGRPGPGGKMFDVCPPELLKLKGSLIIALTGLLIEKHEKLALIMTTEGPWCLLGRLHTGKYATPYEAFPVAAAVYKFSERWTLQEFGRLYAIVQINAILAYSPLSSRVYGAGLFNGSVFFNHSCIPNAIASVRPGKLVIQALQPIEAGEEVTISYKELPVDVLTTNLVRTLHYDMGLDSTLGCRCQLCMAAEETESTLIVQEGGDPNNDDRVVQMDLSLMWTQGTNQRLSMDEKLLSFVTMMIRDPGQAKFFLLLLFVTDQRASMESRARTRCANSTRTTLTTRTTSRLGAITAPIWRTCSESSIARAERSISQPNRPRITFSGLASTPRRSATRRSHCP